MIFIYNAKAIKEDVSAIDIARDILKLEIETRGSNHYIKCPSHFRVLGKFDEHFGSCVLTDDGYWCHACHIKVGKIDMVMEHENCTFREALDMIGDYLEEKEKYHISPEEIKENAEIRANFPLSVDELIEIGLYPYGNKEVKVVVNSSSETYENDLPFIKKKYSNGEQEYLYYQREVAPSIYTLYKEDNELYSEIIRGKANEKLAKYETIEKLFLDRNSILFPLLSDMAKGKEGFIEEDELFQIRNIISNKKRICKMILASISG